MRQSRPKNLNLLTIHFPLPAVVSILHRISGCILFLLIPMLLWVWSYSLTEPGFVTLQQGLDQFYVKFILWLVLVPFCFHLVAGVRHLLMDIHLGETLRTGRVAALLVVVISIAFVVLAGIWLW